MWIDWDRCSKQLTMGWGWRVGRIFWSICSVCIIFSKYDITNIFIYLWMYKLLQLTYLSLSKYIETADQYHILMSLVIVLSDDIHACSII